MAWRKGKSLTQAQKDRIAAGLKKYWANVEEDDVITKKDVAGMTDDKISEDYTCVDCKRVGGAPF